MRFEYRVEEIENSEKDENTLLADYGVGGWELCSVVKTVAFRRGDVFFRYYFKRPVATTESRSHGKS